LVSAAVLTIQHTSTFVKRNFAIFGEILHGKA
jgi:hypothetical protein